MKETFIQAIHDKKLLKVRFFSKQDGQVVTRTCAPMDFGPSNWANDNRNRYHFWDYDSPDGPHTLSLPPEQVREITALEEEFDPSEFVSWDPAWIVERDWGALS